MPDFPFLDLVSDAGNWAAWGTVCWTLAGLFALGDWQRIRRRRSGTRPLDRVGMMPWTPLFFVAFLAGVTCLVFAAQAWRG